MGNKRGEFEDVGGDEDGEFQMTLAGAVAKRSPSGRQVVAKLSDSEFCHATHGANEQQRRNNVSALLIRIHRVEQRCLSPKQPSDPSISG